MDFLYTNIVKNRGKIVAIGYDTNNGEKLSIEFDELKDLSVFLKTDKKTKYRSYIGNNYLRKKSFNKIKDYNNFLYESRENPEIEIYDDVPLTNKFIHQYFDFDIVPNHSLINIGLYDIETTMTVGEDPDSENTPERITSIVLYATKSNTYYILADKKIELKYFSKEELSESNFKLFCFTPDLEGEYKMLKTFAKIINKIEKVDVLSAYFGDLFDNPYILNRTKKVCDQYYKTKNITNPSFTERNLSPLGSYYKTNRGDVHINGIQLLDYFKLYDKYEFDKADSWKLDAVAKKFIGAEKVKYDGSLMDLYNNDYEKYVYYNFIDVKLLKQLDEKLNFMKLHISISYLAKQNYEDTFSPVRTWESIFYNKLRPFNILFNPKKFREKMKFLGAYTHDPIPGFYKYIMSFDLNSLYPHLIMQYYISPESLISQKEMIELYPDNPILEELFQIKEELEYVSQERPYDKNKVADAYDAFGDRLLKKEFDLSFLKEHDITMTPSIEFFRKDENAVVPEFMNYYYDMRKIVKKSMLEMKIKLAQKKITKKEKEKLIKKYDELKFIDGVGDFVDKMKDMSTRFHLKQMALKILLNSAYGAFGNIFFRFFSLSLAKSITSGGRLSIRSLIFAIENNMRTIYEGFTGKEVKGTDFFIYSDTDSCTGDTLIKVNINNEIKEMRIDEYYKMKGGDKKLYDKEMIKITDNEQALSFNYEKNVPEMKNIKYVWQHKVKKKLFKIRIKDKEVIITEDHSIIIYRNGKYLNVKPMEIKKTDKIIKLK